MERIMEFLALFAVSAVGLLVGLAWSLGALIEHRQYDLGIRIGVWIFVSFLGILIVLTWRVAF